MSQPLTSSQTSKSEAKAQHTPESWRKVRPVETGGTSLQIREGAKWIASVNSDATANLFAAAPDLLAACKKLVEAAKYLPALIDSGLAEAINEASAAIAKAEGRTS